MTRELPLNRKVAILWCAVGVLVSLVLIASFAVPVSKMLPADAVRYADSIMRGVMLVQVGLVMVCTLSFLTSRWCPSSHMELREPVLMRRNLRHALVALALVLTAALLRWPALSSSLWWDELGTVVRIIQRSYIVVFTFSANGGNHIFNSALMKAAATCFGEGESLYRLPAFFFGIALPPMLYLLFVQRNLERVGLFAGVLAVPHISLIVHSVEARGYAGGTLFASWSSLLVADLLAKPRWSTAAAYVVSSVFLVGFVQTGIVVPISHGIAAICLVIRDGFQDNRRFITSSALPAMVSCLWVGGLSLVLFGIPLAQTLDYARSSSDSDHLPLNWHLISGMLVYLTGASQVILASLLVALSAWGLFQLVRDTTFLGLGVAAPAIFTLAWLLAPGGHFSPRLFFFLLPGIVTGLAYLFANPPSIRPQRPCQLWLIAVMIVWWLSSLPTYERLIRVGNPDLRSQSLRQEGRRVGLSGPQSDLNLYYFQDAKQLDHDLPQTLRQEHLQETDTIIHGFQNADHPRPEFIPREFRHVRRLPSWNGEHISFDVYEK